MIKTASGLRWRGVIDRVASQLEKIKSDLSHIRRYRSSAVYRRGIGRICGADYHEPVVDLKTEINRHGTRGWLAVYKSTRWRGCLAGGQLRVEATHDSRTAQVDRHGIDHRFRPAALVARLLRRAVRHHAIA